MRKNMIENSPIIETAVLVGLITQNQDESQAKEYLEELEFLADTAGAVVKKHFLQRLDIPNHATFVGSGKLEEIGEYIKANEIGAVIFDDDLSPTQLRNIEKALECKVLDRTFLILEIFAQRARSHEGKLQVELARLQYLSTRLVRRWSHLERQSGGIGMRGGPGEAQIELDRRMIGETIKRTKERLAKVKKQRQTQRRQRERRDAFNISLIGYTNAGKSTLFNALVKARAYAADQLFATLDTTTRQLYLGEAGRSVSLSDTVGFIRDLPHGLVDAFQATLQEAIDADLLLHVVDASNEGYVEQIAQVQRVLTEIGAQDIPQLLVFNKIDALGAEQQPLRLVDEYEIEGVQTPRVFVSAKGLQGVAELRQKLSSIVSAAVRTETMPTDIRLDDPENDGAAS